MWHRQAEELQTKLRGLVEGLIEDFRKGAPRRFGFGFTPVQVLVIGGDDFGVCDCRFGLEGGVE